MRVTDLPGGEAEAEGGFQGGGGSPPKTFTFNWKPLPPGTSWADITDDELEGESRADVSEDMDKLSRRSEDLHVDGEY